MNRVPDGKLDAGTLEEIRNQGLELLGVVPHDDQVYQYDCDGKQIIRLPKDSPVRNALGEIVKKLYDRLSITVILIYLVIMWYNP